MWNFKKDYALTMLTRQKITNTLAKMKNTPQLFDFFILIKNWYTDRQDGIFTKCITIQTLLDQISTCSHARDAVIVVECLYCPGFVLITSCFILKFGVITVCVECAPPVSHLPFPPLLCQIMLALYISILASFHECFPVGVWPEAC